MKSRRSWILILAVAAAATIALKWYLRETPVEAEWPDNWRPRVVRGVVTRAGEAVAGAEVLTDTMSDPSRTDAQGRFEVPWGEYILANQVVSDVETWAVAARCERRLMKLRLQPIVKSRGRVVDVHGAPVANARVTVPHFYGFGTAKWQTAADGSFDVFAPRGESFDMLLGGYGLLPYVERRFRGGDPVLLRAFPGKPVIVIARDPHGRSVNATAALDLPFLLRGAVATLAADDSGRLVWVRAFGFLPVRAEVGPHRRTEVILWPERVVRLRVADSVRKRGVPRLAVEVEVRPTSGTWRSGEIVGAPVRSFLLVPGHSGGLYKAHLPACAVHLRLTAPGYFDAEVTLDGGVGEKRVWMRPLPRAIGGTIEFSGPPGLPIVVADATGRWRRVVGGDSTVEVPSDTIIQVASLGARAGQWLPKLSVKALKRGERRSVTLRTRPAVKVELAVTPKTDGEVTVTDVTFEALKNPQRLVLRAGALEVWGRPGRVLRFDVKPDSNHVPVSFELEVDREGKMRWPITLGKAAGLRYGIRDRAGNAVPFARVRLWEPGRGGQLELRVDPRVTTASATGSVLFQGLRGGETAVEVVADGFRRRLFTLVRIAEGELRDGGILSLEPEGTLTGTVRDYAGQPVAGAWMRVLQPAVRRLPMPGGGERDLYDMVRSSTGRAATGQDGRFSVPDDSARSPLLACYPSARQDLVRTPFLVGEEYRMTGAAYVELDAPGSIAGVYQLLPGGRAVLIAVDPPMSLRPLPLELPAGKVSLFVRLRNRRWAARQLDLRRGEKVRLSPDWRDPLR